jgi:hypothetical protein
VLDLWQLGPASPDAPVTTVANWSAYSPVEVDGITYGQKDVELTKLASVPARAGVAAAVVAAGMPSSVISEFRSGGWEVMPAVIGAEVTRYREFVRSSVAELSAAKHGYVASRSGWLSDRTVCYLASGRPAIVQSTGQERVVAGDAGLITFQSADEAVVRLREVRDDLERHVDAALDLARSVFAHDVVLPSLLATAG